MPLQPGARLGPYEIVSVIGAGGMGEVYRGRDTRLDREVAIKVLLAEISTSEEARQRFEREAKTISSLSHPHICALFDIGNENGVEYLVMEYLKGETLSERLQKSELPLNQVLRYGTEIADALDRAHRQGIVHRDLKPANVMITNTGVKLLDFGLAKAIARAPLGGGDDLPTVKGGSPLTVEGTILGTFQYMAPEQLEGKEADARTDLFAFGAVLYEMATGRRAFSAPSHAALISSIMKDEPPPLVAVDPKAPAPLERVIRKCLAKDPDDRWQSAHDVGSALRWIAEDMSQSGTYRAGSVSALPERSRSRMWLMAGAGAAAVVLLASLGFLWLRGRGPARPDHALHALVAIPEEATFPVVSVPEISPDGTMLVWSGSDAEEKVSTSPLWIRSLTTGDARALAGTDRGMYAFWSPDSKSLGFFADRKLKRVDLAGGTPTTLCDITDVGRGGSWSRDGVIIFSGARAGGLLRIPAAGGTPEPLTKLDAGRGDSTHRWPHFLPDGKHFLYLASPNVSEKRSVVVGSLDGRENRPLSLVTGDVSVSESGHPNRTDAIASVAFADGHLFYVYKAVLYARPFDPKRAEITGPPSVVAEKVGSGFTIIRSMFSVSQTGDLVYVSTPSGSDSRVEWIDRESKRSPTASLTAIYGRRPALSGDGRRLAIGIEDPRTHQVDIWTIDVASGARLRLTFGPGNSRYPVWSPDSTRIAYAGIRSPLGVFAKSSTGGGPETRLLTTPILATPTAWSPDGRFLLFNKFGGAETKDDILALPVSPPGEPSAYLRSPAAETDGSFSADGKYVAYASDESGRAEVYVQSFPVGNGKWQISTEGGAFPHWSKDGKEIYFVDDKSRILAASVHTAGTFAFEAPRTIATAPQTMSDFDPSPDGQRFLAISPVVDPAHTPLHLIANWPAGLKK
jgi:serine/threonine protein kinase/Tol biopolymer transport system component